MNTTIKSFALLTLISLLSFSCNSSSQPANRLVIGVQTYSFRTMDDQSPLAVLEYVKQTGIKNVELMGNHAEPFAGAPKNPMSDPAKRALIRKQRRKQELTDKEQEQIAVITEEMKAYQIEVQQWRKTVDYSKFEALKERYAEAGISIFAFKPRVFGKDNTDDDIRYGMRAAKALGASHITLEHPSDDAHTERLGRIGEEEDMLVAYHGHMQQHPTLWDTAISQSSANRLNLDFGHYIAAENEHPLQIIKDKNAKIASMHLKDRQKKSNGGGNLLWGTGDTPIAEVIDLIKTNRYNFPVTIELEYSIPEGSNAVEEVKRCLEYIHSL